MEVTEAIRNRKSTRAFLPKPVDKKLIKDILECARWAPSGVNSQPWQVAVVFEETKNKLANALAKCRANGESARQDYDYYPTKIEEPYHSRKKVCGKALYTALNIQKDDIKKRKEQWMKNYYSFDAPVVLYFFIDEILETGSWVDCGMFIQNVMLAARGFGLETCAQAALAEYPDVVRNILKINDTKKLICGMALGHANYQDASYQYRTEREPVETFTSWFN
jgi:nitroreductase